MNWDNERPHLDPRQVLLQFARPCGPARFFGIDDLTSGDVVEVSGHPEVFVAINENGEMQLADYDALLFAASTWKLLARPPVAIQDWVFDALEMLADGLPGPNGILFENPCWRCKRSGFAFFIDYPGSIVTGGEPFSYPGVIREIRSTLRSVSPELRLGTVKKRYSRTVERAYRSQGCPHCDALWGDFPLEEQALSIAAAVSHGEPTDRIRASWEVQLPCLFEG